MKGLNQSILLQERVLSPAWLASKPASLFISEQGKGENLAANYYHYVFALASLNIRCCFSILAQFGQALFFRSLFHQIHLKAAPQSPIIWKTNPSTQKSRLHAILQSWTIDSFQILLYYMLSLLKQGQLIFRWISVRQTFHIQSLFLHKSLTCDVVALRLLFCLFRKDFRVRRAQIAKAKRRELLRRSCGERKAEGRQAEEGSDGVKVFQCYLRFLLGVGCIYERKMVRQIINFQNCVKRMEGQLKIENSLCLLEDEMEEGRNVGCWSIQQNLLYAIFIDHNKMIMISKKKIKKSRIFDQMSHFIATRNSLQCRSHHQKLIEKLAEIKAIILAFKKYFGKQYYRQQFNLHTGKNGKKEIPNPSSVKCEDNNALDYCPSANSLDFSQHIASSNEPAPATHSSVAEGSAVAAEHETGATACKAEPGIQYYFPYNYFIGNSILQFPFAGSYFALQPTVPN